jgi:hypothetical protein
MKARTRCPWLPNQKNKLYYPSYLRDMVSIPVVNWPLVEVDETDTSGNIQRWNVR